MNFKEFLENKDQELEAQGYKFIVENNLPRLLTIICKHNLTWVGEAAFTQDKSYIQNELPNWAAVWDDSDDLKPNQMWVKNLWVDPKHQRKGIATTMYERAEQATGNKIVRTPAHTPDSDALWSQPNRRFGH